MFVKSEFPFQFVESEDFRDFVWSLQPQFEVSSRTMLRREILELYGEEKTKFEFFQSKEYERVCLTTNLCTSIQNLNYMCLTVYFIDNDWKLHKKSLNFSQTTDIQGSLLLNILRFVWIIESWSESLISLWIMLYQMMLGSSISKEECYRGVEWERISYKDMICPEVETKWNSTYLMFRGKFEVQRYFWFC